jgi:PAS domain S-box-containing protein
MFYYRKQPTETFEYVSPAVRDMVGWPPEAFLADPQLAIEMLHCDYRASVLKAIDTGSEDPIVAKLERPDGEPRWIEYRNFAFRNDENNIVAIGGTIRDVTDRVQAEEDLARSEQYRRALLDAAPDTIFRLDSEGAILDYVPGQALGELMTERAGAVHSIAELIPLAYVAPAKRLIHDAVRTGEPQRFEFESLAGNENPYGLTYRELAVLHLVAEGSADKQIAEALGISIYTANKHVGNILGKMNAASRTEAGVRALREGLLG